MMDEKAFWGKFRPENNKRWQRGACAVCGTRLEDVLTIDRELNAIAQGGGFVSPVKAGRVERALFGARCSCKALGRVAA